MLGCESGWTDRQRHSLFELSDSGAAGKWTWAAIGGGFGQVIQEVRSDRTCPSASSAKCTLGHMSLDGRQPALQSSYMILGITFPETIRVWPNSFPSMLTIACHSDAAFANVGEHTQTRCIAAFTEKSLQNGAEAKWVIYLVELLVVRWLQSPKPFARLQEQ